MNPTQNQNPFQPGSVVTPGQTIAPNQPTVEPAPAATAYQAPAPEAPAQQPVAPTFTQQGTYQQPGTQQAAPSTFAASAPAPAPAAAQQPNYADPSSYAAPMPAAAPLPADVTDENTEKSYVLTLALSYFLGSLGIDRFYLGKNGTAVAKLLTFGGFGIWQLIDLILVAFNKLHAKGDDRPLDGFAKNFHWVKITAIVLVVFNFVVIGGIVMLTIIGAISGVQDQARLEQYNTTTQNQTSAQ